MSNQTFIVVYQGERFIVNPLLLSNSSFKFRDLISEVKDDFHQYHLRIEYDKFSSRNIQNFLKLSQNQQADVQDSEVKEICYIAKMFKANEIYKKGISFIHTNIDPDFFVTDNQFDEINGIRYLNLEKETSQTQIFNINVKDIKNTESESKIKNKDNNKENNKKKLLPVYYEITSEIPFGKCPRFYLRKGDKILYMAKQKESIIYIGEGNDFHIGKKLSEAHVKIIRDQPEYNVVYMKDQRFKVRFNQHKDGTYSVYTSFILNGQYIVWKNREPKDISSFNGFLNHMAIDSKKNILMQNSDNKVTFIFRKVGKKTYEAECHHSVDPIIVFAISLSEMIGPISFY